MKTTRLGLLAASAAGAAILGLQLAHPLDLRLLDAQFAFLHERFPVPAPVDVVIVGIDQQTESTIEEPSALWHAPVGTFLEAAARGGARAVGVDLVLPDRSYDAIVPGSDRRLLAGILAMRRAGALVLGMTAGADGHLRRLHPAFAATAGENGIGFVLWPTDADGRVRRFHEHLDDSGAFTPTLTGQVARHLGKAVEAGWINFALGRPFDFVPLHEVLTWQREGAVDKLRRAFDGRVVLLGSVRRFEDRHLVPVSLAAWEPAERAAPGVLLHAQTLRGLLAGRMVQPVPAWLLAALGALCGLAWLVARPGVALAIVAGGVAAALVATTWLLAHDVYVPGASFAAALVLPGGARAATETVRGMRDRRRLREAFAGQVSPGLMAEIEAGRVPGLRNERYYLCVLFLDIRDFTTRSEGLAPEAVIELVNRLFEACAQAIHARDGTIDKFTGDGVMAFFGAPLRVANPCEPAFAAARDILARLGEINESLAARGDEGLRIGIGLHCGEAVVGRVGAASRHAYTAMGDCVNVAARIEGLTKDVGYPLVVSRDVADRLADLGGLVALGPQKIKGHTPVEVLGWR